MRSEKSRGLYEALQRSRKGMTHVQPSGDADNEPPVARQQAFPFKPQESVRQQVVEGDNPQPAANSGPASGKNSGGRTTLQPMPLLAQEGPKGDEPGHGASDRPPRNEPPPMRNSAQGKPGDAAGAAPPASPPTGGRFGGMGGRNSAPGSRLAGGFNDWKPLIAALLGVMLALFVLVLLIMGLVRMFDGGDNASSPADTGGGDAGPVVPQNQDAPLEQGMMNYDESLPPGEPVGEPEEVSTDEMLLPDLSGPYRIVIVTTTQPNLERVQSFMLQKGIPTRIVRRSLMTEQTFPSDRNPTGLQYLDRIKSLAAEYSQLTRGQTNFDDAYFLRQAQ